MRKKIIIGLCLLIAIPILVSGAGKPRLHAGIAFAFMDTQEFGNMIRSDFMFNILELGVHQGPLEIRGEMWLAEGQSFFGIQAGIFPFKRALLNPYLFGGLIFGGTPNLGAGMKIMLNDHLGLRAEVFTQMKGPGTRVGFLYCFGAALRRESHRSAMTARR